MESADDARRAAINALVNEIFCAAPSIYKALESELENHQIEAKDFIEFAEDLACYVLHLFDRSLSDVTDAQSKSALMDDLCLAVCHEQHRILEQIGFDVSEEQVRGIFGTMYTTRQLEYGHFEADWYAQVSLRFGRHACEALEIPEGKKGRITMHCALLAPEVFKELLPALLKLV